MPLSGSKNFVPLGFSPFSAAVISRLSPTGLPSNIDPYCRTLVRTFSSKVSGAILGAGEPGAAYSGDAITSGAGNKWAGGAACASTGAFLTGEVRPAASSSKLFERGAKVRFTTG